MTLSVGRFFVRGLITLFHIIVNKTQVNYTKRELHNVFIEKLYRWWKKPCASHLILWIVFFFIWTKSGGWDRENLIEELLKEPDELAIKRKRTQETLRILQQANRVSWRFILKKLQFNLLKCVFLIWFKTDVRRAAVRSWIGRERLQNWFRSETWGVTGHKKIKDRN